jgi:hypothetical protein
LYPHERSLVERYRDRPFVLLGVNSDPDREHVKHAVLREQINWRSWWAGSVDGEIPRRYLVGRWPTMYLLDSRGKVRHSQIEASALDDAIEKLVREAERG